MGKPVGSAPLASAPHLSDRIWMLRATAETEKLSIQVPRGVRGAVGSPSLTYGAINHTPRRRRMARASAAHAGPARVRRALRALRRSQRARSNCLRVSQKVMVLAPAQARTRCGARETSRGGSKRAPRRQRCVNGVFSIKRNVPPRTLMAAYS